MNGIAGAILTLGLGSFSTAGHLVTLGYGNGAEAVVVPTVTINVGGGGAVLSWKEALQKVHEKRMLERDLILYGRSLLEVQKKIKVAEKKAAKAKEKNPEASTDGILANLWKLAEKREDLKLKMRNTRQELLDIQTALITSERMNEYEEEENDIEMLLLS